MPLQVLVVASETPDQRRARRDATGTSSDESYALALKRLRADIRIDSVSCVEEPPSLSVAELRRFDGIFFAGSPIQMHEQTQEAHTASAFMTQVFASGTPSFGSCAGLQIAAVAAGGTAGPRSGGMEAAFARNITMTEAGRTHPMLKGRPPVWMAPAMHSSVVMELPDDTTLLASNPDTPIEAVEIRHDRGVFWGVQYHPEISLTEIAISLQRQASDLVKEGLGQDSAAIEAHAQRLQTLDQHPERQDLAWQLGLDTEVTRTDRRMLELTNFLEALEAGMLRPIG